MADQVDVRSQRATFQILPGLPPYGPLAKAFPSSWGRTGHEGLVVAFANHDAPTWVGNFRPGFLSQTRVVHHPDGRRVLVLSSGNLWVVDVTAQSAEEFGGAIDDLWEISGSRDLVLSLQGLALLRLGMSGVVWHTRRLSWDGFRDVAVNAEAIRGIAWSPLDDRWHEFQVDCITGMSTGGSFGEHDAEGWEILAQ